MNLFKHISLIGLTFFGLLLAHSSASAKGQTRRVPVWEKVALMPFTIVPRAIEGALVRVDQDAIMQWLSVEAGTRVERLLLKRRVAATAPIVVSGTVTLPVSLPRGVIGLRASSYKDVFATAKVLLTDVSGKILAQEEVALNWGDVWWIRGGRARHNHSLNDVLVKFTRKSVDRAVEKLVRHDLVSST